MELNQWSVVPTADNKGVSVYTEDQIHSGVEVCVAIRDGELQVRIHVPGFDEPFSDTRIPCTALERS